MSLRESFDLPVPEFKSIGDLVESADLTVRCVKYADMAARLKKRGGDSPGPKVYREFVEEFGYYWQDTQTRVDKGQSWPSASRSMESFLFKSEPDNMSPNGYNLTNLYHSALEWANVYALESILEGYTKELTDELNVTDPFKHGTEFSKTFKELKADFATWEPKQRSYNKVSALGDVRAGWKVLQEKAKAQSKQSPPLKDKVKRVLSFRSLVNERNAYFGTLSARKAAIYGL